MFLAAQTWGRRVGEEGWQETPGQEAGQEGETELMTPTHVLSTLSLELGAGVG